MTSISTSLILLSLLCGACGEPGSNQVEPPAPTPIREEIKWDFDEQDIWAYSHQDTASVSQWKLENGSLYLSTRANTRDRSKMYTTRGNFQTGEYTWRMFVSSIKPYEQVSFAGFIYQDDEHELDFEIGYGTAENRESYGAKEGDLLACMTSQARPFSSAYTPISPGWHTFTISLEENDGKYVASWIIDGTSFQRIPLKYGTADAKFHIFCSVENLLFMGDHLPESDYTARFDYVSFNGESSAQASTTVPLSFVLKDNIGIEHNEQANVFADGQSFPFTYHSASQTLDGKAPQSDTYLSLYPYDAEASVNRSIITTQIPSKVTVGETTNTAVAVNDKEVLAFKPVLGQIEFRLNKDLGNVSEITLSSSRNLSGTLSIDTDEMKAYASKPTLTVLPSGTYFKTGTTYSVNIPAGDYPTLTISLSSNGETIELEKANIKCENGQNTSLGELAKSDGQKWETTRWDFENGIDGWYYYTHTENPTQECYSLEDGVVKIWTNANTLDRNKLHTYSKNFGEGVYTFRTYVSQIAKGEKCSIGAFIYSDDKHELDFEIGYGKDAARSSCGASADQMVACLTNQGSPYNSTYTPISVGWHDLTLAMEVEGGKYIATWYIDDELVKTLSLGFGPEVKFLISISVENLEFMGDHTPTHTNYGLFDYVIYKSKTK